MKIRTYLSDLTSQMKLNMDHYLNTIETTGTLIFTSDDLYEYDAASSQLSEYAAISLESSISDTLSTLCMMENYIDFGIVYQNNHVVGKISNNTLSLSDNTLYEDMVSAIVNQRTQDGWMCGYHNDYTRIYYVKRVNEGAVFFCSLYISELSRVFELSEDTKNFTTILTDQDYNILYSPDRDEIGRSLSSDLTKRIGGNASATILDDSYLISVSSCSNTWYVICSIPVLEIITDKNNITSYLLILCSLASLAVAVASVFLSSRLTRPVTELVNSLETEAKTDLLTGLLNKRSFETAVQTRLSQNSGQKMALILFDIDNFKYANDHYGHTKGDQILEHIGTLVSELFPSPYLTGRVGGDEFAVLLSETECSDQNLSFSLFLEHSCQNLCDSFKKELVSLSIEKISLSAGVSFFPSDGTTFEKLYQKADVAMYQSKKHGKDSYTIYEN